MEITTNEQAKEVLKKWLEENHHVVNEVKDDAASFHFEIDYPLGTLKRQRVLQPKEYPGLVVLLNGVAIANDHVDKLKAMTEEERDALYAAIRKDLIFLKNSYDINLDEHGIAKTVQFSYECYFDGLTKTRLYEGLLLNHRTLLYIVTMFNDQFGVPVMPKNQETYGNA
ncbi:MAG: hypothetical protein A3J24_02045 [Deltaproteobacteria bacterium RIFCSPLOWO2_02_FULL_53_8]|nr:MAG: hypothetical protein A3J24_02045 [Deltaproteobacteria bacterium RIFCSPLOWO2_02_FULL_53_8]